MNAAEAGSQHEALAGAAATSLRRAGSCPSALFPVQAAAWIACARCQACGASCAFPSRERAAALLARPHTTQTSRGQRRAQAAAGSERLPCCRHGDRSRQFTRSPQAGCGHGVALHMRCQTSGLWLVGYRRACTGPSMDTEHSALPCTRAARRHAEPDLAMRRHACGEGERHAKADWPPDGRVADLPVPRRHAARVCGRGARTSPPL